MFVWTWKQELVAKCCVIEPYILLPMHYEKGHPSTAKCSCTCEATHPTMPAGVVRVIAMSLVTTLWSQYLRPHSNFTSHTRRLKEAVKAVNGLATACILYEKPSSSATEAVKLN